MDFVTLGVRSSEEIPWHPGPGCKVGDQKGDQAADFPERNDNAGVVVVSFLFVCPRREWHGGCAPRRPLKPYLWQKWHH